MTSAVASVIATPYWGLSLHQSQVASISHSADNSDEDEPAEEGSTPSGSGGGTAPKTYPSNRGSLKSRKTKTPKSGTSPKAVRYTVQYQKHLPGNIEEEESSPSSAGGNSASSPRAGESSQAEEGEGLSGAPTQSPRPSPTASIELEEQSRVWSDIF